MRTRTLVFFSFSNLVVIVRAVRSNFALKTLANSDVLVYTYVHILLSSPI